MPLPVIKLKVDNGMKFLFLSPVCMPWINENLKELGDGFFIQNIPFAFYYSIPDNALPLLWKGKLKYTDNAGIEREWYGLVPREY